MNRLIQTAISVALILMAQNSLACDYPQRVDVPDGATASKDDMISGQRGVKSYISAMETYLACIEAEEASALLAMGEEADEDTKLQREEMFNKKYNAAVEEMNLVAEEFNVQVRAYKARSN
jgi:hypothetical protein